MINYDRRKIDKHEAKKRISHTQIHTHPLLNDADATQYSQFVPGPGLTVFLHF